MYHSPDTVSNESQTIQLNQSQTRISGTPISLLHDSVDPPPVDARQIPAVRRAPFGLAQGRQDKQYVAESTLQTGIWRSPWSRDVTFPLEQRRDEDSHRTVLETGGRVGLAQRSQLPMGKRMLRVRICVDSSASAIATTKTLESSEGLPWSIRNTASRM